VKALYQYWIYHYNLMNLTSREYEYYSKLVEIAGIQYRNSEISILDKSLVETSFAGLKNEMQESERLFGEAGSLLKQVLQVEVDLVPGDSGLARLPLTIMPESGGNSLITEYYDDLYKLELANVRLERSRFFPGLSAMYFNQTIDRETGFSGFKVGMSFPLWFVPQGGRVEQAKIRSEIAHNRMQVEVHARNRSLENLLEKIRSYDEQLAYYESTSLESSRTLIQTANLQLEEGGIEYFEFIGSVSVGLDIQREYLRQLNHYNQAVIELEYLQK
jgi:cobalt-zinc-cadmium resistance protein CzcA